MHKTVVLNVVGLSPGLIGADTPFLRRWADGGALASVASMLPAVTCSVQATYLPGVPPSEHGIVGNGWYDRDDAEVKFWKQSNRLVQAPKVWDRARALDPEFTCATLFWWYNMYSSADVAVTPRPMYPADGRKIPDVWTQPAGLRSQLQDELGRFPLFEFWGPNTTDRSTRWIADAAKSVERRFAPTLTLVYLPHLDYVLQRHGPGTPEAAEDLRAIDGVCADLIRFYEARGARVVVLSEYGISPVRRPVHLNRMLRAHGFLALREELGREHLDAGASRAFAVADHQVAHVYVQDTADLRMVRDLIEGVPGVERVLGADGKREHGLDHARAGDLVAVAEPDAWFTYYFWEDDDRAPDYARTVDIHRKPGYDPAELFIDPELRAPKLRVAQRLAQKKLGFRTLLDVIPLDATLVRGSHGRAGVPAEDGPLLITRHPLTFSSEALQPTDVHDVILAHLTADAR